MRESVPRWTLTLTLTLGLGCGGPSSGPPDTTRGGALGTAAARVNGELIALAEVERLSAATGLSPRVALSRLVAERLLVQHATGAGYDRLPAVQQGIARARVRALLARELESDPAADVEQRRQRLTRWLAELARQTPIRYEEANIRAAFAAANGGP